MAKPFLKWAGGKGQLLEAIRPYYPFEEHVITKYAEPFIGGGAVLFDILERYKLEAVYISDVNPELINAYRAIQSHVDELILILSDMQHEFNAKSNAERKVYYMEKRHRFNALKSINDTIICTEKAALMIFLNRTCFNRLFRVNGKGFFNVPMGSYKNPLICHEENLRSASQGLQNVSINSGNYQESISFIDAQTFVYFDPPYRPLTTTASFTSYTKDSFDDKDRVELAHFIHAIHQKGARFLLSNSDPKNSNEDGEF